MILLQWLATAGKRQVDVISARLAKLNRVLLIQVGHLGIQVCEAERIEGSWRAVKEFEIQSGGSGRGGIVSIEERRLQLPSSVRIREALESAGVRAKVAFMGLPRRYATIRLLDFSTIERDAIPEALALEFETNATQGESLIGDYLCTPDTPGESRYVLSVQYDRSSVDEARECLQEAGIELLQAGISELGASRLLADPHPQKIDLVAFADAETVELVATRRGMALCCFTIPYEPDLGKLQKLLAGSVARVLHSLPPSLARSGLNSVSAVGTKSREIAKAFEAGLQLPTAVIPLAANHCYRPWAFLNDTGDRDARVDFLHAKPCHASTAGGSGVTLGSLRVPALLLAFLVLLYAAWLKHLDRGIAQSKADLIGLQNEVKSLDTIVENARTLEDWQANGIDLTDEIQAFLRTSPASDRMYFRRLRIENADSQQPMIVANGFAREGKDVFAFNEGLLNSDGRYLVQPVKIDHVEKDPQYLVEFEITAAIDLNAGESNVEEADNGSTQSRDRTERIDDSRGTR